MNQLKIGTAWVRGVVGRGLNPELVIRFASAFGTWADGGPVAIARDTRRSSVMFRSAVISGLLSTGSEIIDLGTCTTPMLSFGVRELGLAGGIMISGSHNDAQWNALKFLGPDGALLNAVRSEELFDIYHAYVFRKSPPEAAARIDTTIDIEERYLEHLQSALDILQVRRRRFRVAVDFCGGPGASVTSQFLDGIGCSLIPLNSEPTGVFPHAPAPSIDNMSQLSAAVLESGADLGIALNVDGDRAGFVTQQGVPLSEECTLPLAAIGRLRRRPGVVITNFSSSRMIDVVAERFKVNVQRANVGESSVMDRGLEVGAVLAGEGSGGVGVLPVTMTFDALLTLGMVLEAMAAEDCTLSEMVEALPKLTMRKGEIPCQPAQSYRILDAFRSRYRHLSPDCTDGARVDWPGVWMHVRASKTEPLVRVIVEAETETAADKAFEEAHTLVYTTLSEERESS